MTKSKGPSTSTKVSGPSESAAAKQVSLTRQSTAQVPSIEALRAQLGIAGTKVTPTARTVAVLPRAQWDEVIVRCTDCRRLHRHHIAHDDAAPVVRVVRCGLGRTTTYVVDLGGAL